MESYIQCAKIIISGQPIAKARARVLKNGHSFDPQQAKKEAVAWEVKSQMRFDMIEDSLNVDLMFYLKRPVKCKHSKPIGAPDLDNLIKFYLDAMNGVAYTDDSQITHIQAVKQYDTNPRTVIIFYYRVIKSESNLLN